MEQLYEKLRTYASENIDHPKIKHDLTKFKKSDTSSLIPLIKTHAQVYPTNSVGEYLYSCFLTDVCTPGCLSGLQNPDLCPCEETVYVKDKKLRLIQEGSCVAIVYSTQILTAIDFKQIFASGISKIINKRGIITHTYLASEQTKYNSMGWFWLFLIIVVVVSIIYSIYTSVNYS